MNKLMALLLITSFPALSCPDLSGTYVTCKSDSNRDIPKNLTLEVSMTNDISYLITLDSDEGRQTQDVIADGVERERVVTPNGGFGRLRLRVTAILSVLNLSLTDGNTSSSVSASASWASPSAPSPCPGRCPSGWRRTRPGSALQPSTSPSRGCTLTGWSTQTFRSPLASTQSSR